MKKEWFLAGIFLMAASVAGADESTDSPCPAEKKNVVLVVTGIADPREHVQTCLGIRLEDWQRQVDYPRSAWSPTPIAFYCRDDVRFDDRIVGNIVYTPVQYDGLLMCSSWFYPRRMPRTVQD